jgi:hypothetical protein
MRIILIYQPILRAGTARHRPSAKQWIRVEVSDPCGERHRAWTLDADPDPDPDADPAG